MIVADTLSACSELQFPIRLATLAQGRLSTRRDLRRANLARDDNKN
jgi:hypothetical protein